MAPNDPWQRWILWMFIALYCLSQRESWWMDSIWPTVFTGGLFFSAGPQQKGHCGSVPQALYNKSPSLVQSLLFPAALLLATVSIMCPWQIITYFSLYFDGCCVKFYCFGNSLFSLFNYSRVAPLLPIKWKCFAIGSLSFWDKFSSLDRHRLCECGWIMWRQWLDSDDAKCWCSYCPCLQPQRTRQELSRQHETGFRDSKRCRNEERKF